MNRRTFLAGLLASTALRTLPARSVTKLVVPVLSSISSHDARPTMAVMRGWSYVRPADLTLAALEELAAAVRASFLPDPYQRHMIGTAK